MRYFLLFNHVLLIINSLALLYFVNKYEAERAKNAAQQEERPLQGQAEGQEGKM